MRDHMKNEMYLEGKATPAIVCRIGGEIYD